MPLSVYNTMTNSREEFIPQVPGKVSMYACGVTVYDVCHIGHGMQAIVYDVIRNYLEFLGFEVTYIRNYTDVDDKIINRANEMGIDPLVHSENMIRLTEEDLAALGVAPATVSPKVSDHIPEIIALIEKIMDAGSAYEANGDVYYRVRSFSDYGCLSNRNPEELRCGARIEVNPNKEDPLDFTLWKAAKAGEVAWDSPWGKGRPGWHIECSALAMKFLGETFDIHGGGKDLIFPHHENEVAQSMKGCQGNFARYWIHNGLVTVDGRKMAKSFNNFMSIKDALAKYYPETLRFTILSHHYSANIDFSEKSFYDAYQRLMYYYKTFQRIEELRSQYGDADATPPAGVEVPAMAQEFEAAMNDDFNTALALAKLNNGFKFVNDLLAAKKPKLKQKAGFLIGFTDQLKQLLAVFNLIQEEPTVGLAKIQAYLVKMKGVDTEAVEALVRTRNQARADKDWAEADRLRDALAEMGIAIMDTPDGTQWYVNP